MIRSLIEADYIKAVNPGIDKIKFWLMESRTPIMLVELSGEYKGLAESLISNRPLLAAAINRDISSIENELEIEQKKEREADRLYWEPLFKELEKLRHQGYDSEEKV